MNSELLEKIVNAVLYEGYILYPYRPSVKNHQRWTFGGLYPQTSRLVRESAESSEMQTQCLVEGSDQTSLQVSVRFLHLTTRTVAELAEPVDVMPEGFLPEHRPVETLSIGDKRYQSWQEATERAVEVKSLNIAELAQNPLTHSFSFAAGDNVEPLRRADGKITAILIRRQEALAGVVEVAAEQLTAGLFRISVRAINRSSIPHSDLQRDVAQLYSLASTHTILGLEAGSFVSSIDPPTERAPFVSQLRNVGSWPVLVGEEPARDTMLASPIILYDYPQIAPESPGNLFDSTEIDEILSLRIMTLTDDEKRAVVSADGRGAQLLERTDTLAQEQLASLHGAVRGLRPLRSSGETS